MDEVINQFRKTLDNAQNILLVTHKNMDGDGLASMLVMKDLLVKFGKQVTSFSADQVPESFSFLPGVSSVVSTLPSSNDFVVSLNCKTTQIEKVRYSQDGSQLNIVVTPKNGTLYSEDLTSYKALSKYDLIIVLDSGDLEHLGKIYEENTDMFFSTPVVNIDHHISNSGFGQLNIVDVTVASTTHIVYEIIKQLVDNVQEFMTPEIATLLLTGLIVDTGSFQHANTSPRSLEFAADLIEYGAKQQEIIQNIYKTKPLSTLKLWGRILTKIKEDKIRKIVWSTITKSDLLETGATPHEAEGLIDELMTNAPGAEIVVLLKDSFDGVMSVSLRSTSVTIDTLPISRHFGGGGHKQASGFKQTGSDFHKFETDVIEFIESYQVNRLCLSSEEIQEFNELNNKPHVDHNESKTSSDETIMTNDQASKRDLLMEMSHSFGGASKDTKVQETTVIPDLEGHIMKSSKDLSIQGKETENVNELMDEEEKNPKTQNEDLEEGVKNEATKKEVVKKESKLIKEDKTKSSTHKPKSTVKPKAIKKAAPKKVEVKKEEKIVEETKKSEAQKQDILDVEPQNNPVQTQQAATSHPGQSETQGDLASQAQQTTTQGDTSSQTQATATQGDANQTQQITKEQAVQYSQYYAAQLQNMDPNSQAYADNYSYYQYYAQLAQTL